MIAQIVWIYLGVSIDCLHIWHFQGEGMTSIEPTGGRINDICVFSGTGLLLVALDSSQIPSYFIPALGPAPKWCSYLENLTVWLSFLLSLPEYAFDSSFWLQPLKSFLWVSIHRKRWRRVHKQLFMMISSFWQKKILRGWIWLIW